MLLTQLSIQCMAVFYPKIEIWWVFFNFEKFEEFSLKFCYYKIPSATKHLLEEKRSSKEKVLALKISHHMPYRFTQFANRIREGYLYFYSFSRLNIFYDK